MKEWGQDLREERLEELKPEVAPTPQIQTD